jgi:hypothetical protein
MRTPRVLAVFAMQGCKVLVINGTPLSLAMKADATAILEGTDTCVLNFQFDPVGFAQYDSGKLLASLAAPVGERVKICTKSPKK